MTLPIDTGSIGSGSNIENEGSVENIGATAQPQQPSTEQTAETVELIVNETNPFRDGDDGVFEAVCLFEEDAPIPETHEVATTYVNGSNQTLPEAQCEGLYLSEVRGGPVRMIYNPGGGGCSRISRRPHFSHDHPLCQALLDYLHTFFTHPTNEGRRHTIIFYGDGGAVVQAVLEHSPYVDLIDVVGIAPTVYVTTGNTRHFRVSGDMTTLFDRTGFSQTNVTTLPYSSGAEGVFFPSIRCPSYQWALRMTALQTGDVQEENEEESGGGG
ncbi:DUF687 family protein [Chlamydia vaughanii]|uniref:DUF687 family protein n=1 Tax=Chlamydia vaughanii TaxID=3112552 RepID=UPI0032B2C997